MKKGLLAFLVLGMSVSLTGCFSCDTEDWKEKYGTPELFIEHITDHWCYIYPYDSGEQNEDTNFEIRDALKEAAPYVETTYKASDHVDIRYFTYEIYIGPSTTGPNYCKMSVYDDGLVIIHHKYALGPHGYVYYSMDQNKAYTINDLVVNKIDNEKQVRAKDLEAASNAASIENFIAAMEEKAYVPAQYQEYRNDEQLIYPFKDTNKELLSLIKEAQYFKVENQFINDSIALVYNYAESSSDSILGKWYYSLFQNSSMVRITFGYKNRFNEVYASHLLYSIDASKAQAILTKAKELAK